MGYKEDQSFPSEYEYQRPQDQPDDSLPSYSETVNRDDGNEPLNTRDPRSTSTESLTPEVNARKRTLLLIYIHGFLGNETSFQSFPAHVHNLVCSLLSDSHVVHTKIYPRYKSRKVIEFARNDFSNWLRPHESYSTDVILLGHSMGGILGAEVAIMPASPPSSQHPFQHKLLGTINFDTPFLGMHPGIVFAGIGSLFRPAPEPPKARQQAGNSDRPGDQPLSSSSSAAQSLPSPLERNQSVDSESSGGMASSSGNASSIQPGFQPTPSPLASPTNDPNYNPQYSNDAPVPKRQGWDKALNFWMKHAGNITTATKSYVTSHWEFSGALADYSGLKNRYTILRLLEDGKDINGKSTRKIRFVNYYTASSGRPPKEKVAVTEKATAQVASVEERIPEDELTSLGYRSSREGEGREDILDRGQSRSEQTVRGSLVETDIARPQSAQGRSSYSDDDLYGDGLSPDQTTLMTSIEPEAEAESEAEIPATTKTPSDPARGSSLKITSSLTSIPTSVTSSLPPLGPLPQPPGDLDLDAITDKDERKLAVKEYSRQMQAYQRAMKDREKATKERQKLLEKQEKAAEKERLKHLKQVEKEKAKAKKEAKPETVIPPKSPSDQVVYSGPEEAPAEAPQPGKKKSAKDPKPAKKEKPTKEPIPTKEKLRKDRKFCMLPPKDSSGHDDKCWPRVFMEGVDEVGAHCGLFMADRPHYEGLVYNVGNRIKDWVMEGMALHEERLLATQDFDRWREKR